ncbi:MAG: CatB-related O-acetyltransferase [Candidatus Odinarchaeota archaeon]
MTIRYLYYLFKAVLYQPWLFLRKSKIHLSCWIGKSLIIYHSIIGRYCYIGPRCILKNAKIGNYCSIAPNVQIGGMEHTWWWGSTSTRLSNNFIKPLTTFIEDDVWIATNVVIKQGVKIGRGAVIGSSAVVTHDIPPYSIAIGVPARVIKKRFPEEVIKKIEKTNFWKLNPKTARKLLQEIEYDIIDIKIKKNESHVF